jgi:tetratricopeptide (TPR) repeat protein
MRLFGPPDVSKCRARRDIKGLIDALNYQRDAGVRCAAARALGELNDTRGVPALISALRDSEASVRAAAQAALEQLGQRPAQAAITVPLVRPEGFSDGQPQPPAAPARQEMLAARSVRVFISSTFRDMQAERDELVQRAFPALRACCQERGLDLVEVDLRWGVTEAQAERGEVLPTCLAEIDACRPFLIGLLGERYGWVPAAAEVEPVCSEFGLTDYQGRSVTELEIQYAILKHPEQVEGAFFYFRDPAYLQTLAPEQRPDFEAESETARAKLNALKNKIRKSGFAVMDNYLDPQAVAKQIVEDLCQAIKARFPGDGDMNPLDRAAREQEFFVRRRTKVYLNRTQYADVLNQHAAGSSLPLVVLGEAGTGKTALLADWVYAGYKKAQPSELVLAHFIGSTPQSADWRAMLQRMMGELQRTFQIQGDIPDEPEALRADFAAWLRAAGAKGRVVLVLDGLDHLEERDNAASLAWLPSEIPPGVRLVLSTAPGPAQGELQRRGWKGMRVEPLAVDERAELIAAYLRYYGKGLSAQRIDRIAAVPLCAQPVALRAVLDELRIFGIHEKLDERIDTYLAAATPIELYGRILARYEVDYERGRPGLVRDAMALLWAARRGLAESEMLDLLSENGQPLIAAIWSPLKRAINEGLEEDHSGRLHLPVGALRTAVEQRYLPGEAERRAAHQRLAAYFAAHADVSRKLDELPWQLAAAGDWQALYDLLAGERVFAALYAAGAHDLKAYWAQIQAQSDLRLAEGYRTICEHPERYDGDTVWNLGNFFEAMGCAAEALALREYLSQKVNRPVGDGAEYRMALINQAKSYKEAGRLDEAWEILKKLEPVCRELGDMECLQRVLSLKGLILRMRGQPEPALAAFEEGGQICATLKDLAGVSGALGNRAIIHQQRGELDQALALHREEARLCRELGDLDGLEASVGNQGLLLLARNELSAALALLKEQEALCRKLGKKEGLHISLGNQGIILRRQGNPAGALALYNEKERLCRELGSQDGLATALINKARVLILDLHRPAEAVEPAKEAYEIARTCGFNALAEAAKQVLIELIRTGYISQGR